MPSEGTGPSSSGLRRRVRHRHPQRSGDDPPQQVHEGFWEQLQANFWPSIWRALLFFALWNYMSGDRNGLSSISSAPGTLNSQIPLRPHNIVLSNGWNPGLVFDMRVFLSEDSSFHGKDLMRDVAWEEKNLVYSFEKTNSRAKNLTLRLPENVLDNSNSSLWLHAVFSEESLSLKTEQEFESAKEDGKVLVTSDRVVLWDEYIEEAARKNLLEKQDGQDLNELPLKRRKAWKGWNSWKKEEVRSEDRRLVQVFRPQMTLNMVHDLSRFRANSIPEIPTQKYSIDWSKKVYYPPVKWNNFWTLQEHLVPLNSSFKHEDVTLGVNFEMVSLKKSLVYAMFDMMLETQLSSGLMTRMEADNMKRIFLENNPYFLLLTSVVSLAHTFLSILAFNSEIGHWRNIKSMEGVSVKTLFWDVAMESIILLFLLDNDTSWTILFGNVVTLGIAIWKLGKAVKIKSFGERKLLGFIPWFVFEDQESYAERTKEYDEQAMKYLSWALYPIVILYSIYSLVYEKHRSWYSWIIGSLVGVTYTFGFIMMFPQIFINYKLKSVAHLPLKAMMFKTLNTIIDDMFSFIIKMPWMHRLACFRDDVVFVIFLYQRYIYPVDKTRVNEFGQSFEDRPDASNGLEAEACAGSKAKASVGPKAKASVGPKAEASIGLKAKGSTGPKAKASTGPEAEASTGLAAEASTGLDSEASTGLDSDSEASTGPETEASVGPEALTGPEAKASAEPETEVSADARPYTREILERKKNN